LTSLIYHITDVVLTGPPNCSASLIYNINIIITYSFEHCQLISCLVTLTFTDMNQANAALFFDFLMSQQQKPAGASLPVVPAPVPVPAPVFQQSQPPPLADFFRQFVNQPPPPPLTPAAQSVVPAPPIQGIDHQLRADVVEIRDSLRELLLLQQQANQQNGTNNTGNKGGNGGKKFGGGGGGPYGRKFGNGGKFGGGAKGFVPLKQIGGNGGPAAGNNITGGQPAGNNQQASGSASSSAVHGVVAAIQQPAQPVATAEVGPAAPSADA
jgi:hypothetical protein